MSSTEVTSSTSNASVEAQAEATTPEPLDRHERLARDAEEQGYPEHAKLHRLKGKNEVVSEFVDWLRDVKEIRFMEWVSTYDPEIPWSREGDGEFMNIRQSIPRLLSEFFEIDLDKIEAEKREMLRRIREAYKQ